MALEEVRPQIAVLALARSSLDADLVDECLAVLDRVDRDNSIRVVVLTGAGDDFCTGTHLPTRAPSSAPGADDPAAALRLQERLAELLLRLRRIPQPVIAAVEGRATGAGFALALLSDLRVASTTARFATQFASAGVSGADTGTSWVLPRLIGASRASELVLTGREIDADEAERIGLLARVTGPGGAVTGAVELADELCALSPFGVVMTKEVMWANLAAPSLEVAVHLENRTQILASRSGDFDEAVRAFAEKRRPDFRRAAEPAAPDGGEPGR